MTVMDLAMTAFEEARNMEQGMMDVAEAMSIDRLRLRRIPCMADKLAHMQTRYAVLRGRQGRIEGGRSARRGSGSPPKTSPSPLPR